MPKAAFVAKKAPSKAERKAREKRDAEIVRRLKAREHPQAVAQEYGVSVERVRTIWRAATGLPLPRPLKRDAGPRNRAFLQSQQAKRDGHELARDEELAAMATLVKAGFSVRKAGAALGLDSSRAAFLGTQYGLYKLSRYRKKPSA